MATQQTADMGAGKPRAGNDATPARQMAAGTPEAANGAASPAKDHRAPRVLAAFGTGGGAAIVFSDLASI